ncbi:MAG: ABC transporter ATP-binding protein [Oscillospiraceae bacterium]
MLEIANLGVEFGGLKILDDISFSLESGQWLMLVGPNGAGKSTIVNSIAGGCPHSGTILLEGENIAAMKPALLAQKLGFLSQSHNVGYSFTVKEVVALGRYAYSRGFFGKGDVEGKKQIDEALALTGLSDFAERSVLSLSGGELQRCFLAQLFAQNPKLLVLDEPTNNLDLLYQKQVFELLQDWISQPGRAVISVVHDLSLARAFGTHALLLDKGKIVAQGKAAEVISDENLRSVYGMDVGEFMRSLLAQWGKGSVLIP